MQFKLTTKLLLLFVFLVALFLRVYKLGSIPVSLTMDEVAIAYNSYSILETGRDEFGKLFPLAFRSVGDYKPPLLIYAQIPATAVCGLNEYCTRITVAVFGALSVLFIYGIVKLLTNEKPLALLTALLVAISPWHIKFSRSTFEAILALFLIFVGVYMFLLAVKNRGRHLWISAVFFSLSLYAYHAERVFTPLFVLGLFLIYRKELLGRKTEVIKSLIVGIIVSIPLVVTLVNPSANARAQSTFITRDFEINSRLHKGEELSSLEVVFDNNLLITFDFWTKRYLDYYDPSFIFVDAMEFTRDNSPDIGLLYLFEIPFFIFGLYLILIRKEWVGGRGRLVVVLWLLLGPLAASLANNPTHPLRSLTIIPIYHLFSAAGAWYTFGLIRSKKKAKVFALTYFLAMVLSVLYFLNLYFLNYQLIYSEYMMDGWKDAARYVLNNRHKYQEVVVDPRFGTQGPYTVGAPYLYILYYGSIDPAMYQSDTRRGEFDSSSNFENITFREINWAGDNSDRGKSNTLFIGSKWVLPENDVLEEFRLYNGEEILRAYSVD